MILLEQSKYDSNKLILMITWQLLFAGKITNQLSNEIFKMQIFIFTYKILILI